MSAVGRIGGQPKGTSRCARDPDGAQLPVEVPTMVTLYSPDGSRTPEPVGPAGSENVVVACRVRLTPCAYARYASEIIRASPSVPAGDPPSWARSRRYVRDRLRWRTLRRIDRVGTINHCPICSRPHGAVIGCLARRCAVLSYGP